LRSSDLPDTPPGKAGHPLPLYLTFAVGLFAYSSVNAGRVLLSLYALHLGAQASAVGLLFASYFVFPLLLSWPVGKLSDRIGSRWLLLFGGLCSTLGMLIPYLVRSMPALYWAGLLIGLSFACSNVLVQNLVGLLSQPHQRVRNFSNFSLVASSTSLIGPLVAGLGIDYSGHAVACLYVVVLGAIAVLLPLVWGRMLPGAARQSEKAANLRDTMANPAILRILATSSLVQVGFDLYQFYLPVYGYGIGLSASAIGVVLAIFAAASFVVRIIMPNLIARLGEEKLLALSFCLAAAGFALIPAFSGVVALSVVSFMFGLGMGCGQPITTMLLFGHSPPGRSGEILGLRQTANNILRVTSPTVFGLIASAFGLLPVFGASALMMAAGALFARPRKPHSG
jgi:MFS family permease